MKEPLSFGTFTCDACHGVFGKAWSDEAAFQESEELFADHWARNEPMGMVCDDCFKKFVPSGVEGLV